METSGGYPEEQTEQTPSGDDARDKDSSARDRAPDAGQDQAPDNEDGTATGNPHSAGED